MAFNVSEKKAYIEMLQHQNEFLSRILNSPPENASLLRKSDSFDRLERKMTALSKQVKIAIDGNNNLRKEMNQRIGLLEQRIEKLEIFYQEESRLNDILGDTMEETETNLTLNETIQTMEQTQTVDPIQTMEQTQTVDPIQTMEQTQIVDPIQTMEPV